MVLMRWMSRWLAQGEVLFDHFDRQVALCVEASKHLSGLLEPGHNAQAIALRIGDLEATGDALFAQVQQRLALSYIVPVLRRHEAAALSESLEAILNQLRDVATTMRLLDGAAPDRQCAVLITSLQASVEKLGLMVPPLRTFEHCPILEARRAMTEIEKDSEQAVQLGTSRLFCTVSHSAKDILRYMQVFDALIRAIRRCHHASKLVEHIALRHGDFSYARYAPDT
jgi:uncharacterized protein Yka (UPF0111/DUF47 family)